MAIGTHLPPLTGNVHELKTDPAVFEDTFKKLKTFEIRKDDRNFEVGDVLYLRETVHTGAQMLQGAALAFTGREVWRRVIHTLPGPVYGIKEGWIILSVTDEGLDQRATDPRPSA